MSDERIVSLLELAGGAGLVVLVSFYTWIGGVLAAVLLASAAYFSERGP